MGVIEAVNGNIKALLRRGCGYRDMNYLLLKAQRLAATKTEFVVLQKAAQAAPAYLSRFSFRALFPLPRNLREQAPRYFHNSSEVSTPTAGHLALQLGFGSAAAVAADDGQTYCPTDDTYPLIRACGNVVGQQQEW